jgi:hypothetical protein
VEELVRARESERQEMKKKAYRNSLAVSPQIDSLRLVPSKAETEEGRLTDQPELLDRSGRGKREGRRTRVHDRPLWNSDLAHLLPISTDVRHT